MRYLHNKLSGEIHRLDDEGRSLETCNVDDISGSEELDEAEALRLVAENADRRCGHCWLSGNGDD